jgi:hypothetical protein
MVNERAIVEVVEEEVSGTLVVECVGQEIKVDYASLCAPLNPF